MATVHVTLQPGENEKSGRIEHTFSTTSGRVTDIKREQPRTLTRIRLDGTAPASLQPYCQLKINGNALDPEEYITTPPGEWVEMWREVPPGELQFDFSNVTAATYALAFQFIEAD